MQIGCSATTDIIVIDERAAAPAAHRATQPAAGPPQRLLSIFEYKPGYSVQRQLSMREVRERRTSASQPLWVLMSPDHWSALRML